MSKLSHKLDLNTRDYLFIFDDKIILRHCEKKQYDIELLIDTIKNIDFKPASPISKGSIQFICNDSEDSQTIKNNTVIFKGNSMNKKLDDIIKTCIKTDTIALTSSASCCICDKPVNGFGSYSLSGGAICLNCFEGLSLGKTPSLTLSKNDAIERKEFLSENATAHYSYKPEIITMGLTLSEETEQFTISGYPDIIPFSALVNFEYVEDGNIVTSGGLGRAVAGGLLFGAAGAIVGGVTGTKKSKDTVTDMHLRVVLDYRWFKTTNINFSYREIKKDSSTYKTLKDRANQVISALELISHKNEHSKQAPSHNISSGIADELLKLKELLNMGILSQDEFEAQKAKLLK